MIPSFHVYIEKAYSEIQGAYPMINQQFVLHEMQDCLFINREEDDGVPGLRRAKESYYPIEMIEKYTAVLKRDIKNGYTCKERHDTAAHYFVAEKLRG